MTRGIAATRQAEESRVAKIRAAKMRHGEGGDSHGSSSGSPEYTAWKNMKRRCRPGDRAAKNYHDRGIAVCPKWANSYPAFIADVGRRPSPDHSLDRKDNNKGYEPGNVRWATDTEQASNKQATILLRAFGETKTATAWSRDARCMVSLAGLLKRVARGIGHESAIADPEDTSGRFVRSSSDVCKYGHRLSEVGFYISNTNGRSCKACVSERSRLRYQRSKQATEKKDSNQ